MGMIINIDNGDKGDNGDRGDRGDKSGADGAPRSPHGRSGRRMLGVALAAVSLVAASCGSESDVASGADLPTVAVTTNILGDVVENLAGDQVNVVTIMPVGADPHDFQASAQQVVQMTDADVLVVNGADFEEGMLDVIESAEADGVPIFEAISAVSTIEFGEDAHGHEDEEHGDEDHDDEEHGDEEHEDEEHGDEDHDDEEHGDEEHEDEEHRDEDHDDEEHEDEEHGDEDHDEHAHVGADPHFFVDPSRMAVAADGIADFLAANVPGIDVEAMQANAADYVAELEALDGEVEEMLSAIPDDQRIMVTNHEVFGYFADRYDFEVVGTVIPSGSTNDGVSAEAIVELAEVIEHEGVQAIFADTSSSDELAVTLADEVGAVQVVELFSESLGADDTDGSTYVDMVRSNAAAIAAALAG